MLEKIILDLVIVIIKFSIEREDWVSMWTFLRKDVQIIIKYIM